MIARRRTGLKLNDEVLYIDNIKVIIAFKDTKYSNMRLNKEGDIKVTFSLRYPNKFNENFFYTNIDKLVEKAKTMVKFKEEFILDFDSYNEINLMGNKVPVFLEKAKKFKVENKVDHLIVHFATDDVDKLNASFRRWIKKFAHEVFSVHYQECFLNFSKQFPKIDEMPELKIRDMKSCWGICKPQKNEITLALRLIMFDEEIIDYIIFHELSHLIVQNHGNKFYEVLDYFVYNRKQLDYKIKEKMQGNEVEY